MNSDRRRIVVTGANGFLGSNLVLRLREEGHHVCLVTRETASEDAAFELAAADIVFHLAGANRPQDEAEFMRSNRDYTRWVADAVAAGAHRPLLIYSSSAKAMDDSAYGRSKRAGEQVLLDLAERGAATVSIWRLPNLCGKWSRPNYNSVVATFCHNAARGLPLPIDDPSSPVSLLYVDDLIDQWLEVIGNPPETSGFFDPENVYRTSVGELAEIVEEFADGRCNGTVANVGTGLVRALYSTFTSMLPPEKASYPLRAHEDSRGTFVELLKTAASGQLSYFTTHPGATRGGHYHHSKVEKFLVAHGTGRFRFRHALSGESFEVTGSASEPRMIETIPGWTHDVTNIGDDELVVFTWANEQFDPERPDTYPMPL